MQLHSQFELSNHTNEQKGLNNWIELYNNDRFKTKKEKKRMSYYIIKLNEFERLLND